METPEDLERYLARTPRHVKQQRRLASTVKRRIRRVWGDSLDLLVGLLYESRDLAEQFLQSEYEAAKTSNDLIFFAAMHLHASACLITSEVLTLLETGYSIGASARWRTLHEVAVYAQFIVKHGPRTAERYLRHVHIKDWDDLPAVDKLITESEGQGFSPVEREMVEKLKAQLLQLYGEEFKGRLGWAKEACPKKGGLSFNDIAEDVGLDLLDSFYRTASHAIHPTWKGIVDNNGLLSDLEGEALLAGPSELGIWTPAMLTARSIYSSTVSFVTCRKDSDWQPRLKQLSKLVQHTSDQLRISRDSASSS
jgi:hypothetical protein